MTADINNNKLSCSYSASFKTSSLDGEYIFKAYAKDDCGNESANMRKAVLDTTNPVVTDIKVAGEELTTDTSYNGNVVVSYVVQDTNFNNSKITVNNRDYTATVTDLGSGKYKCEATINKDINAQTINITATDKATNTITKPTDYKISVDATYASVNKLTLSNNDIMNKDNVCCILDNDIQIGIVKWYFNLARLKVTLIDSDNNGIVIPSTLYKKTEGSNGNYTIDIKDYKFEKSGVYKIKVDYNNYDNTTTSYTSKEFIIDGDIPEVNISAAKGETYVPDGQTKEKSKIVSLVVKENNTNPNNMTNWQVKVTDSANNDITTLKYKIGNEVFETSIDTLNAYIRNRNNWTEVQVGYEYSLDIEFLTEGNYSIKDVVCADMSGQESLKKELKDGFCIDGTKPTITNISYNVTSKNFEDYKYISNKNIVLSVKTEDSVSDIKSVVLNYKDNGVNGIADGREISTGTYLLEIPNVNSNFKGSLENITVTDTNNNVYVYAISQNVIIDKESNQNEIMKLTINDDTSSYSTNVFNKDINLSFIAEDDFAGIAKVKYTINNSETNDDLTGKSKISTLWTKDGVQLKAIKENEGEEVKVALQAEDNAGNVKSIEKKYIVDLTKPVIEVSYDKANANAYYNDGRTVNISVTDKHINVDDIVVTVNVNGNDETRNVQFSTNDNVTYTGSIDFATDGDYRVSVVAKDLAGNEESYRENNIFTVDRTNPNVTIEFDNNSAVNQSYYNSKRVATVTVNEHNFDSSAINLSVAATLDGGNATAPQISAFTSNGDVHTAQMVFDKDGDYSISGTVTDKAGNVSNSINVDRFTIDQTVPVITISNVSAGESYNDVIKPSIEVTDVNYSSSDVHIDVTGSKNGKNEKITMSKSESDNGGTFTFADFAHDADIDDYYTLDATIVDLAGNEYKETVEFKVNRFGSVYSLNKYTSDAVSQYYTNAQEDFVILEENVDEIEESELYYSKDGDIVYLKEGVDYTQKHSVTSSNWNQYEYDINTDNLTTDGIYSYGIYSKDKAGNESDNKSNGLDFEICVDKTVPVCTISGVKDGDVYEEASRDVSLEVYDNICLDRIEVYVNDKMTEYKADDITDNLIKLTLGESSSTQEIKVICYDMAGNIYNSEDDGKIKFTISTNAITKIKAKAMNNIVFIIIAGILAFAFIIIVLVYVKRKKKEIE